ncbi:MAG: SIS domain-containing protein [Acidobacteria bacterium]|nr:SIS domain-containing protein [Acidobacteriota bacterium]
MTSGETARRALVVETFQTSARLHQALADGPAVEAMVRAGEAIVQVLGAGGQVLVFGNGGSAADAQHLVAELVGRFERRRRGFPAVALTTDPSVLTAVANDYGFEAVFARQIDALGRAGDLAIGITTSGNSPNVVAGLEAARVRGLRTLALTGNDGGAAGRLAEVHVNVPEAVTARVQEAHVTVLHLLCAFVDREVEG